MFSSKDIIIILASENNFSNLIIPPHCPDDGLSLGLIEFLRQHYKQEPFEKTNFPFWQDDYSPKREPSDETILKTAEWLAQGKIIGWYQGNGELGPRALGNRSILMNPTIHNGKHIINQKVKKREWFRPFAPVCREQDKEIYFDDAYNAEYMSYAPFVKDEYRNKLPSITHVDGTARLQTVNQEQHNLFYSILTCMDQRKKIPVILNTSFNIKGRPILTTLKDAFYVLDNTELDFLVVENLLIIK